MTNIHLDGNSIKNRDDLYNALIPQLLPLAAKSLGADALVGRSLDAIYDVLTGVNEPVRIHINNASAMLSGERTYYDRFMKMLRALAGENPKVAYEVCEHTGENDHQPPSPPIKNDRQPPSPPISFMSTKERGYAKINLSLDVTGKLPNGYHLVKMVMASVSLCDELTFAKSDKPGIRLVMAEDGNGVRSALSLGEDNLIVKAARAIADYYNDKILDLNTRGLDITLCKNIPMAAGMAGGSADAAATLRALNRLYDLDFSTDELCEIGVKLGADVPFCVRQGCYLSEGIGEVLTELPSINETIKTQDKKAYIALIKPPIDVSTKYVYEHLDTEGVQIHPDVDKQIAAIQSGDLNMITDCMRNVLRDVTVPAYPIVLELENFLKTQGALNAMMSGSGPTVFGIFDDEEKCKGAVDRAKSVYPDMFADMVSFL